MSRYSVALFALFLLTAPAFADDPKPIADPEKSSEDILADFAENRISDVATKMADVTGAPEQKPAFESLFRPLDGKTYEFRKKVVDKDYAGALRQIVHYAFVKEVGFVCFRLNYKQAGSGWILANFAAETTELFPPGMNIE
jgi:hypothetical protein